MAGCCTALVTSYSQCNRCCGKPREYFHIMRSGGGGLILLDLTSSLEAKLGARSSQVHQIRAKTWEVLLPQDTKVRKESQFWQRAKRGVLVTYISGCKLWGSDTNFRANFGPPPDLLIWKHPLGVESSVLATQVTLWFQSCSSMKKSSFARATNNEWIGALREAGQLTCLLWYKILSKAKEFSGGSLIHSSQQYGCL